MTVEEVIQKIREAVETASGWTTIVGPAQGPEPANQYCLVTLNNIYKQPHDVVRYNYSQAEDKYYDRQRSESTLTFEIQARGYNSMATMDNVASYFDNPMRDVDLWGDLGSAGHDDAQSVDTYHQGKILEVAIMMLSVNAALIKTNSYEWFNSIDITTIKDNNIISKITVPEKEEQ